MKCECRIELTEEAVGAWVCPECGPITKVDEDGCCLSCGAYPAHAEIVKCALCSAASALLEAAQTTLSRLQANGDWDEGCFYYNDKSASELQMPIGDLQAAIREARGEKEEK